MNTIVLTLLLGQKKEAQGFNSGQTGLLESNWVQGELGCLGEEGEETELVKLRSCLHKSRFSHFWVA